MSPSGVRHLTVRILIGMTALLAVRIVHAAPVIEWHAVRHPGSTATVESVVFTSSSAGWMLQRDGTVLRSADGGASWTHRSRLGGSARRLVAGAGVLVAAGDGAVWISTNDGVEWRESRVGTGGSFNAAAVGSDGAIWVAGMAGEVHASRDGGVTWSSRGRPVLGHLFALAAGPAGVVLAGGLRGLWETRDGGARWSYVNLDRIPERHTGPRPAISDLVVAPDGVWIAGWLDDFAMLWRADWKNPTGAALVHHEDDYRYVRMLRGPGGLIWVGGRHGFCARSADDGRHWSQEPPGLAGELRALALNAAGVVFAGGEGGALFSGRDPAASPAARIPSASSPPAP